MNFLHVVQTGCGVNPASYPMGTGGKSTGVRSWPLMSSYCQGQENVDLYIHSPYAFTDNLTCLTFMFFYQETIFVMRVLYEVITYKVVFVCQPLLC
jgi:hypothetical protein